MSWGCDNRILFTILLNNNRLLEVIVRGYHGPSYRDVNVRTGLPGGLCTPTTPYHTPSRSTLLLTQNTYTQPDIMDKDLLLKEDDFRKMEDDLEDPWLETLSDQESFLELTSSFIKDNPPCSPCTPATGMITILHHTPGRQEGEKLLSENPRLGLLSTTIGDGLVGDQSWPTRRGDDVTEPHKIVGHASFEDEGSEGLLAQQDQQECVEAGFLTGQTDRQSVQTAMVVDGEDRGTGLMVVSHGTCEPSSGDFGQRTPGNSICQDDITMPLPDVPGRPPARYQDDNHPDTCLSPL